jgi:hypothetical protein
MLRKTATAMLVLVLPALNWAALHDIIKGEPNLGMEWLLVLQTPAAPDLSDLEIASARLKPAHEFDARP